MNNLAEHELDSAEAEKCLSNIACALLSISHFSIRESNIKMSHAKLAVKKYRSANLN